MAMNKKSSYTKIAKLVALATIAVMGATVIATGGGGMPFEASAAGPPLHGYVNRDTAICDLSSECYEVVPELDSTGHA